MVETTSKRRVDTFLEELRLAGIFLQGTIDNNFSISPEQRARLAIVGRINGIDFERVINELTWQEFEIITTIVGDEFGYEAKTGLNFSTEERKYQIDVVLKNRPYVLLIDCKHLGGTGKRSLLKNAADDQLERAQAVRENINLLKNKLNISKWKKIVFIPLIVTWYDDEVFFHNDVPVVPFSKLRSFFRDFYVYFNDIAQFEFEW